MKTYLSSNPQIVAICNLEPTFNYNERASAGMANSE